MTDTPAPLPPAPGEDTVVPVLRPRLPSADRLLPYLRRIDQTRIYSNWGPLSAELELRLAERLGLDSEHVTSASSGTSALVGAILATAGRAREDRPLAIVPAFTFVATAVAAEQCGYEPHLVDVDADSWALEPGRLVDHPALGRAGVVVPVAPFGRPVNERGWRSFSQATGIPVVIDGAASLDRVVTDPDAHISEVPVALSFHATKCFAAGEGGCVACKDRDLVRHVTRALNFGFHDSRESRAPSINGKMSEYHAAVGLAELDSWEEKLAALRSVAEAYRRQAVAAGLADRIVVTPEAGASYVLFRCDGVEETRKVQRGLYRGGIDWRLWYGNGLHRHPHFASVPRDPLPVTERVAAGALGLPLAPDLDEGTVVRVVRVLAESLGAVA